MSKIVYITERKTTVTRRKGGSGPHDPARFGMFEIIGEGAGPFVIVDATIPAPLAKQFEALWRNHLEQR